ncbi:hypothetical protein RFI_28982 [Reticulomyxa filosa]|uniref:Uncharacterized protein n=1 Tax=Reticulomyxa filosa TaxID=46433 RepID=X6M5W5_RETFI|nr:hypothetical protein RFI_28982 [Reticulomyxa filosa]|eukprot:ETO08405.1 hypothetical protein RFI_28982 [Reticulomyxa filosa]
MFKKIFIKKTKTVINIFSLQKLLDFNEINTAEEEKENAQPKRDLSISDLTYVDRSIEVESKNESFIPLSGYNVNEMDESSKTLYMWDRTKMKEFAKKGVLNKIQDVNSVFNQYIHSGNRSAVIICNNAEVTYKLRDNEYHYYKKKTTSSLSEKTVKKIIKNCLRNENVKLKWISDFDKFVFKYIISASVDGAVNVWNIKSGIRHQLYLNFCDRCYIANFAPDGNTFVVGSEKHIRLLNLKEDTMRELKGIMRQYMMQAFLQMVNTLHRQNYTSMGCGFWKRDTQNE